MKEYDELRKIDHVGFAHLYLKSCHDLSKLDDINIQGYAQLIELDSRLGTTPAEQLVQILCHTTRLDIIKVRIFLALVFWNLLNYSRLSTLSSLTHLMRVQEKMVGLAMRKSTYDAV